MPNFRYPDTSSFQDLSRFMEYADGFNEVSKQAFENKSYRDFDTIKEWIPNRTDSILDIGCGIGGVDIPLAWYTKCSCVTIIDGDGTGGKKTSYSAESEAWADRELARSLISYNVECEVRAFPPDPSLTIEADLIISLKSWGHHYPVNVYIDLVKRSLRPLGRVIMDIRRRRRTDGRGVMESAGFRYLDTTYETPKCYRMVFERH